MHVQKALMEYLLLGGSAEGSSGAPGQSLARSGSGAPQSRQNFAPASWPRSGTRGRCASSVAARAAR